LTEAETAAAIRAYATGTYSQGTPPPAFSPRHTYGGSGTIHRTGSIDIQIAPNGDIEAVWFRCLNLPFTVDRRSESSPYANPARMYIEEITYVDLPSEGSSQ
jgi:hypothetical protein